MTFLRVAIRSNLLTTSPPRRGIIKIIIKLKLIIITFLRSPFPLSVVCVCTTIFIRPSVRLSSIPRLSQQQLLRGIWAMQKCIYLASQGRNKQENSPVCSPLLSYLPFFLSSFTFRYACHLLWKKKERKKGRLLLLLLLLHACKEMKKGRGRSKEAFSSFSLYFPFIYLKNGVDIRERTT